MPPIVPVGLEEPPTDSDNEFYSEDELPNFAFQEDLLESDSSISPNPDEEEQQVNVRYEVSYAYELLPQEPESLSNVTNTHTEVTIPQCHESHASDGQNCAATAERPATPPPPMDKDQIEKIKAVMLNVTLPSSSIPGWAAEIPEHSWKDHLLSRIQSKKDP